MISKRSSHDFHDTPLQGRTIMKRIFCAIAAIMLGTTLHAAQDQSISITSGGIERIFDVHIPSETPEANLPVLICYHGTGGSSASMKSVSGFDALADRHRFIAVYPQAARIGFDIQWNVFVDDRPGHGGVGADDAPDDILFTHDIIETLAERFAIDRTRVFATGLSNGGFMCYALSMLASTEIRAIAPVAASLWADESYLTQLISSRSVTPMPVMHIHGTADNVVDYPDPDNLPRDYEEYPLFISSNAAGTLTYSKVIPITRDVDRLVFSTLPVEVSLVRIKGMGHAWTNGSFATSSAIVTFFGLDANVSAVREQSGGARSTIGDPVDGSIAIELGESSTVELLSCRGEIVEATNRAAGRATIQIRELPSGVYLVRVVPESGAGSLAKKVVVAH
jgi:poly(3-hydroxybutyrate) depolymerase